jgi:hypothetical protein
MSREAARRLAIGGVIAGLGGWLVLPRVLGTAGPAVACAAPMTAENETVAAPAAATEPAPDQRAARTAAPWPADPFPVLPEPTGGVEQTVAEPAVAQRQPALNAIVSGPTPHALIDGKIVAIGDRLPDGSIVTAIGAYAVSLQGPQGAYSLELAQ